MAAKVPAAGVDLDGAVTVNESSADKDFRVESNGDANMLFVDGGQNLVRVGNNAHTNSLIAGNFDLVVGNESSGATGLAILSTNNENSYVSFFDQDNSGSFRGTVHYNHTNDYMQIYTNGTAGIRQHSNQVLSASAGVALGVGTANTASNVLDDYEEGTWTPANAQVTLSVSGTAKYTKIGRFVFIHAYINWPVTSDSNQAVVTGLPFATMSGNNYSYASGRVGGQSSFIAWQMGAGATTLTPYNEADGVLTNANLTNNYVLLSGSYMTD